MRAPSESEILPSPDAGASTEIGGYRVRAELACGGMASIHLAVGSEDPGAVAIKRVHPHLAREREFAEMFVDEARIASRIVHPNVCAVHDWGQRDGTLYLVMELLEGEPAVTLLRGLRKDPALLASPSWPRCAARIVADACAGLHAAHELAHESGEPMEVVHRDVSPHNLFVTWSGSTKIIDFGIASATYRLHQTAVGTVKGKFSYMAPEQLQGERVDRRADVWSLGVVLWELITGRPLFRRAIETETIFAVLEARIPTLGSVREGTPAELEAIVRRALARDPAERTPTALAMQRELEAWLEASGDRAGEQGDDARGVRAAMERLLPGEREASHARIVRALGGDAQALARGTPDSTPPTGMHGSAVRRRARARPRLRWALGALLLAGIGSGALALRAGQAPGDGELAGRLAADAAAHVRAALAL